VPDARIKQEKQMGKMKTLGEDLKEKLNKILSKHTGQNIKKLEQDTDRDYYLSAEEALKYGLVDKIIK
jgi:ATP-dependent Clp protease protease subunit